MEIFFSNSAGKKIQKTSLRKWQAPKADLSDREVRRFEKNFRMFRLNKESLLYLREGDPKYDAVSVELSKLKNMLTDILGVSLKEGEPIEYDYDLGLVTIGRRSYLGPKGRVAGKQRYLYIK